MTLIYLTDDPLVSKDDCLRWFTKFVSKPDEIILQNDVNTCKSFIEDHLANIQKQKHIDFIISDWEIKNEKSEKIISWLRNSTDIYSSKNFNLNKIPVILIEDSTKTFDSDNFDATITDFPTNINQFNQTIVKTIKKWRELIAEDLETLGLDPSKINSFLHQVNNSKSYYRLKVLSKEFAFNKSNKTSYIWTNIGVNDIERANESFYNAFQKSKTGEIKEKGIHDVFLQFPSLVKGENFSFIQGLKKSLLYEVHLYKGNSKSYNEVDFLNRPNAHSLLNPEIFEIKLYQQRIFHKHKDAFLAKTRKAFKQVERYNKYLTSEEKQNRSNVIKHFGANYQNFNQVLLLGSLSEKQEKEHLLKKLKSDENFDEISLLTYEELLENHINLCQRLKDLSWL
ncbi:hypothetical protein [Phnomibacter sp. MR]|uniref:hypothetical protein n=1 Tax=Phnomibacter sp. MR TaxID=3042318 RepID=UPI003A8054D3